MDKYNMSIDDLEDLANYLHKRRHIEYALDPWSFEGSVNFTSVTITTIGKLRLLEANISANVLGVRMLFLQ